MPASRQVEGHFLSHKEYAADCARAAKANKRLITRVQCKIQESTECAIIRDAWTSPNLRDMWTVEVTSGMNKGKHHIPVHAVRRCSNVDGHCMCAGEVK